LRLIGVLDQHIALLANAPLCFEYEAKCTMSLRFQASDFIKEEAFVFVDTLIALVEPVENWYRWRPLLCNHDDEMVLEAALSMGGRIRSSVSITKIMASFPAHSISTC
jgi:hypothetical protein